MSAPGVSSTIDAGELRRRLGDADLVVFDVRWSLDDAQAGRRAHAGAHVPGATYLHLEDDLSDAEDQTAGQMPAPEELAARLEALGVGDETLVVAYDDDVIFTAARLVWMLAVLGHDNAAVLDGGWPAWEHSGGPTEAGGIVAVPRSHGHLTVAPRTHLRRERGEVEQALAAGVPLLDCRMDETWTATGEHIPGARRLPAPELSDGDGLLESPQRTSERLRELDLEPDQEIVLYCGGGISASRAWLALRAAGYTSAAVYDGSWAEWSADPALPRESHR